MSKVRLGIVGAGDIAKAHVIAARGLRSYFGADQAEAEVVAIADHVPDVAESASRRYDVPRWTADWKELVADPEVDAVIIATPNDLHAEIAIAAAQQGKHVLSEKPLARNLTDARHMVDAVTRAGVVNSVNLNYRRVPAIQYARRLIQEGELGTIVSFQAAFSQDWGLDPSVPRSWKFEAARAGAGPLVSLGCHVLDLAHFLVGDITSVIGSAATHITQRPLPTGRNTYAAVGETDGEPTLAPVDVEDLATMLLRFEGGALGTFFTSRLAPGRKNYCFIEISGTQGTVVFDYEKMNELAVATASGGMAGLTRVVVGAEHDPSSIWALTGLGVGYTDTVVLHAREFVAAVAAGTPLEPNFGDGLRVHEVVDAAMRSHTSGHWEDVHTAPRT